MDEISEFRKAKVLDSVVTIPTEDGFLLLDAKALQRAVCADSHTTCGKSIRVTTIDALESQIDKKTGPCIQYLTIKARELVAAQVRADWDAVHRVLLVNIVWHDNGRIGFPKIRVSADGSEATVGVHKKKKLSMLERADKEMEKIMAG